VGESLRAALMARDNGEADAEGQPPPGAFPKAFAGVIGPDESAPGQLFSSDLIFLSNSSNEVSPLIFSPLMKKVGVESTFNTSLAYF
jgi:hypothetical protein